MERFNSVKAVVTLSLAGICAKFGWFEIQMLIYVISMGLDFITGSLLAIKDGDWNSKVAKKGIFHKVASVIAVAAALLADWMIANIMKNIPGLALPFTYTVMLCPLVMIWYTLAELGSVIENVGLMGAPIPKFFKKAIAVLKDVTEDAGEKLMDSGEKSDQHSGETKGDAKS